MKKYLLLLTILSSLYADPVEDLKLSVCNSIPGLYGWCTPDKAKSFIDLVLEVKPDVCVEIGVFGGRSLFPVASALKYLGKGIIIGIDPWDKEECIRYYDPVRDKAHIDWWSKISIDQVFNSYTNMLSQYRFDDQVITLRATSEKAAAIVGDIDILYIDGNHGEIPSMKDVELYLPKVRVGGYIWLNDSLSFELQPTVDLLLESCEFIDLIDGGNCILFRKK